VGRLRPPYPPRAPTRFHVREQTRVRRNKIASRTPGTTARSGNAAFLAYPLGVGYLLKHRLGRGGMGVVDLALDPSGRPVALKRLAVTGSVDDLERARARLRREVEALRQVRHPAIVSLLDVIDDGDDLVLVMPYLSGGSLADRVLATGPLPHVQVVQIAERLLSALATIHRSGIVHRDCKPANVLFDIDGRAFLTDFGVATLRDATGGLTESGAIVGTPAFIAPEQARGEPPSTAADVFALGATLWFAATGEAVYGDTDGHTMLRRAAMNGLSADLRRLDQPLAALLAPMLHPDPRQRPSAARLVGGPQGTDPSARRPAVPAEQRRMPSAPPHGAAAGAWPRESVPASSGQGMPRPAPAYPAATAAPPHPPQPARLARSAKPPRAPRPPRRASRSSPGTPRRPRRLPVALTVGAITAVGVGALVVWSQSPRIAPTTTRGALAIGAVGPTTTCVPLPYQPCGKPTAPFTDGRVCTNNHADYDTKPENGCEAAPDAVDGRPLETTIQANLVPTTDTDSYPLHVDDNFSFSCDGRVDLTLTGPKESTLVLEVLQGNSVIGQATSRDGSAGRVTLREPNCGGDDVADLSVRVRASKGATPSAASYKITRTGNF